MLNNIDCRWLTSWVHFINFFNANVCCHRQNIKLWINRQTCWHCLMFPKNNNRVSKQSTMTYKEESTTHTDKTLYWHTITISRDAKNTQGNNLSWEKSTQNQHACSIWNTHCLSFSTLLSHTETLLPSYKCSKHYSELWPQRCNEESF